MRNSQLTLLIKQVELNRRDERHSNYRETRYWCDQWRNLAIQLAREVEKERKENDRKSS